MQINHGFLFHGEGSKLDWSPFSEWKQLQRFNLAPTGRRSFQSHMYDVSVHSSWAGFTCLYVYSLMTLFYFPFDAEKGKWQDNRY